MKASPTLKTPVKKDTAVVRRKVDSYVNDNECSQAGVTCDVADFTA